MIRIKRERAITAYVLAALLALATMGASPEVRAGRSAQQILNTWLRSPHLKGLDIGVSMGSVEGKTQAASFGDDKLLNPASGAKLLLTGAALTTLGPERRFETKVFGTIGAEGVVQGGIVLQGAGDPKLLASHLNLLAGGLWKKGVRKIRGGLRLDVSLFDGDNLPPAYDQKTSTSAYRAAVGAAACDAGAITLSLRPGRRVGEPVKVQLMSAGGYVQILVNADSVKGKKDQVRYALSRLEDGRMKVELSGSLGITHPPFTHRLRMLSPNQGTAFLFRAALKGAGVEVHGDLLVGPPKTPRGPLLASHTSAPLRDLLRDVNVYSNNFMAEMIFKHLGTKKGGATWQQAQAQAAIALRGLGVGEEEAKIINGSGLYRGTRVRAGALRRLIATLARGKLTGPIFGDLLAVSGTLGTLKNRLKGRMRGRVRGKTGTLNEVVTLSGLLETRRSGVVAFSILINQATPARTARLRKQIDRLLSRWSRL